MRRRQATLRFALLAGICLIALRPGLAGELPAGASIASGSVGISSPGANMMTIQQSSAAAIINWQSFSIGAGATVNIRQPATSSALLNRVTGATTSTIAGQLNANGQVYLVNPNGIMITPTGTVRAGGGFVASTLGITDEDFKAGRRSFAGAGNSATVVNQGTIEVGRGGYAALLGGAVENAGTISVPLGRVGLGAGERATLDISGDGFLEVAVPSGSVGDKALIQQSGRIRANGGRVELKAATAREVARQAINLSGVIEARTVGGRSGAIVLGGGAGGTVKVSGRLDVSATRRARRTAAARSGSGVGGSVTITGDRIGLTGATIVASGRKGGGTVKIGGDLQGGGTLPHASSVVIDSKTQIVADATGTGNGGNVVVWSDAFTRFSGLIRARGGAGGGNGGFAEVSSHGVLDYTGQTILTAARGKFGTLLLDPYDIYIESGSTTNGAITGSPPSLDFIPNGSNSVIDVATLQTALATANVSLQTGRTSSSPGGQDGNITVGAPISWSQATTLTLDANNNIVIGEAVSAPAGGLTLDAGGSITTPTSYGRSDGSTGGCSPAPCVPSINVGTLSLNATGSASFGGTVAIGSGTLITGGAIDLSGPFSATSASFDAGGTLTSSGSLTIDTATLTAGGALSLNGSASLGTVTLNGSSIALSGPFSAGTATFNATGTITSSVSINANTMTLNAGGSITSTGSIDVANTTTFNADSIVLSGPFNAGTATLNATGDITASGAIDAGTLTLNSRSGSIFSTGSVGVGSATFNADAAIGLSGPVSAGALSLNAGGTIDSSGSIAAGTLSLNAGGTITSPGSINVGTFLLLAGAWTQPGGPLPAFSATDFRLNGGSFLRVLGGDGSAGNPYAISDIYGLQGINSITNSGGSPDLSLSYRLANDIDASGTRQWTDGSSTIGFTPIGGPIPDLPSFSGTFDGQGHTISGLFINRPSSREVGLFGELAGTVQNLALTGVDITGGSAVGSVAGRNFGAISHVVASGTVAGNQLVGGLVGDNSPPESSFPPVPTITQSSANVTVQGGASANAVGGLVGYNTGDISLAYATGAITTGTGSTSVGGLVGENFGGAISQAYATTAMSGAPPQFGGLVGFFFSGTLTSSFWDTTTTGQSQAIGSSASATTVTASGLTTTQFQDPGTFVPLARSQGWGFETNWASPSPGFYPELYSIAPVIRAVSDNPTRAYGDSLSLAPATSYGGLGTYIFGPAGDSVSLANALTSPATATSPVGTYAITGVNQTSAGGVNYRVVATQSDAALTPSLTVTPAPLVITANTLLKAFGTSFTFTGLEFAANGLRNGETIGSAALSSLGSPTLADIGLYAIQIGSAAGGTFNPSNYSITYMPGTMIVGVDPTIIDKPPAGNPPLGLPPTTVSLPNPPDTFDLTGPGGGSGGGGPTLGPGTLREPATVERSSNDLEAKVASCDSQFERSKNATQYKVCVGDALEQFADALEAKGVDLPGPLRGIPAVIRQAARQVRAARTIQEARAAVGTAVAEVRKAIALLRADDPSIGRSQIQQVNRIASALGTVESRLSRATGL